MDALLAPIMTSYRTQSYFPGTEGSILRIAYMTQLEIECLREALVGALPGAVVQLVEHRFPMWKVWSSNRSRVKPTYYTKLILVAT